MANDGDTSFPPTRRLRKNSVIQSVFDTGDFFEGEYCHLIRGDYRGADYMTRVAAIVSPKTLSNATDRNRVKRLFKESFRLKIPSLQEGWPIILLATRDAHSGLKRQDIDRELEVLFELADLYEEQYDEVSHEPN